MSTDDEIELSLEKNERSTNELSIRFETLNRQAAELLKELNVTPEQLTALIETKDKFNESNWNEITRQKQEFEDKLSKELKNIRNPLNIKKKYKERKIENHWLFVR